MDQLVNALIALCLNASCSEAPLLLVAAPVDQDVDGSEMHEDFHSPPQHSCFLRNRILQGTPGPDLVVYSSWARMPGSSPGICWRNLTKLPFSHLKLGELMPTAQAIKIIKTGLSTGDKVNAEQVE